MKKISRIITSVALLLGLTVLVAVPAYADPVDVFRGDACNGNTSVCGTRGSTGVYDILKNVINILLTIAGIVSVIMIVVGGIKYSTSGGDAKAITDGKDTLVYAVIGLVISIMAFAIVNFVLGKI